MPTVIQVHFMHSLARTISARTIEKAWANIKASGLINPFKSNGNSQLHQLDQSISVLRVVRCVFLDFKMTVCK